MDTKDILKTLKAATGAAFVKLKCDPDWNRTNFIYFYSPLLKPLLERFIDKGFHILFI